MADDFIRVGVDPNSLRDVQETLEEFGKDLERNVLVAGSWKAAEIGYWDAIRLAPVGKTGRLSNSIARRRIRGPGYVGAQVGIKKGKGAFYARMVEFGHRYVIKSRSGRVVASGHVPARPFLRPALESNADAMTREIIVGMQQKITRMRAKAARGAKP